MDQAPPSPPRFDPPIRPSLTPNPAPPVIRQDAADRFDPPPLAPPPQLDSPPADPAPQPGAATCQTFGTSVAFAVTLTVQSASPPTVPSEISPAIASSLQNMLSGAPQRVQSKSKKPGDPLNLIVIGSQEQILAAFKQAGWSEAGKLGTKSAVGTVRAMASDNGLENAPVSQLYLFGRVEDLAFEKTLNTFLKRHHLRLWRTLVTTPDGRPIWVGASTHDIGLDVHFRVVSHEIDPDLDAERNKVGADLMASGLVMSERLVARPNPLTEGKTATGGTWKTDGQLLVVVLKSSRAI